MNDKLIMLTLSVQQIELIIAALKELPAKHVFDILVVIFDQINEQLAAINKTENLE